MQKICTEGNGENIPMKNDSMSVTEVMVIETAASDNITAMRSGTGSFGDARLQAASITNVSSMPMPAKWCIEIFSKPSRKICLVPTLSGFPVKR